MNSENLDDQFLNLVNQHRNQQANEFTDQNVDNNDIVLEKNKSKSQHSLHKLNFMELSCPETQATKTSTVYNLSLEKQETNNKKVFQSHKLPHSSLSNLQALRHLPREIHKNPNIKIECKTEFPLVRSVAVQEFGWSLMSKENHRELIDLIWTDTYVTEELVNRLRPYQKINHFPYSTQMGRKDYLFANLNKMRQRHKEDYDFFAKTWIFPYDYEKFKQETSNNKQAETKFFIVKPVASCQGKGIYLAKSQDILMHNSQNKLLIQQYIENTMLIDKLKFDVRIYVLITSLSPLKVFIYKEGLTRLATNEYERPNDENYRNGRMHLTNYAINKNNPCFVHNKDFRQDNIGHKRSLANLYQEVAKVGGDAQVIKSKISQIIVKTILSVYEKMTIAQKNHQNHSYTKKSTKNLSPLDKGDDTFLIKEIKTNRKHNHSEHQSWKTDNSNKCFQLLGFDIMIDDKLEPKLIEINHQPSLTSSSPLDHVIKRCLLIDVFNLLNLDSKEKQKYLLNQRDLDPMGNFRNIEVRGAKKQFREDNYNFLREKNSRLGGFSCIFPVESHKLMSKYHKIMPILSFNENQPNKKKKTELSVRKNNLLNQTLNLGWNKASLTQKRTQYMCHYINMSSHESSVYVPIKSERTQISHKNGGETQGIGSQQKIIHPKDFNQIHIASKIKSQKMTEFSVPKKNLHFTIKYKKNKSQTKETQHENHISKFDHQTSNFLLQNRTQTPGRMTFYNNKKAQNQMIQMRILTPNQFYVAKDQQTGNQGIGLQKYSYPILEKQSSTIFSTLNARGQTEVGLETRSIRRNNEFFERIYERQLATRITKMKSMKEKLQSLSKSTLHKNKHEQLLYDSHSTSNQLQKPFHPKTQRSNRQSFFSIQKISSPQQIKQDQKETIYQTIKLMQFQEPKIHRVSHIRMEKSTNLKQRFNNNNSMQMFQDSWLSSQRKKIMKFDHFK